MDQLIFHNDRIISLSEARLSPGQIGLLTGWGVFTTLRIYEGLPFGFDRHWARMNRDAIRLGIPLPYSREAVHEATIALAKVNQHPESMARIAFVKNHGGLWADAGGKPESDLLIFTRPLVAWPATQKLTLEHSGIFAAGHYAGAKMLSWVSHVAVLERAHAQRCDDALLTNEKGQLAECTSANIFLVQDGRVLTPPLTSGCLAGVTREVLLEIAPAAGMEIHEEELKVEDLSSAEEVFISSTTREVAPIESIQGIRQYRAPGPVTSRLDQVFKEHVRAWLEKSRKIEPPLKAEQPNPS